MRTAKWLKCGTCLAVLGTLLAAPSRAQNILFQQSAATTVTEKLDGAVTAAIGDVNGDGRPDILVGSHNGAVLLLGSGSGQFEPGKPVLVDASVESVVLADFDRDGKLDLAVYSAALKTISVLRGAGDGTFGAPLRLSTKQIPQNHPIGTSMIAADLNQDGKLDLVAEQENSLAVFFGNGDGTFQLQTDLPLDDPPTSITAADFNGDGVVDLAVSSRFRGVAVLLGSGKGAFRRPADTGLGTYGRGVAAADFNKDGKIDLAAATEDGLVILLGDGGGGFRQGATFSEQQRPMSIAVGDVNGDGFPDVILGNYYGGVIDVLLASGDGTFRLTARVYSLGDVPFVALYDMNADSKLDLVAASHSSGTALLSLGDGKGSFLGPAHFGDVTGALFRTADADTDGHADLLAVVPLRKTIFLLRRGSALLKFPSLDDYPIDACFGDFNGDKITDVVVATTHTLQGSPGEDFGGRLLFFPGRRGGGFDPPVVTPIERMPVAQLDWPPMVFAAGDFTGDGVLDVALANNALPALQVYRGRGDGTFEVAAQVTEDPILSLVSGDFDGDGIQDLAVAQAGAPFGSGLIKIHTGTLGGQLKSGATLSGCEGPSNVTVADFDGDSKPDLAASCSGFIDAPQIAVFLNAGGGAFRAPATRTMEFPLGGLLIAAADFDGDHKQDLAVFEAFQIERAAPAAVGLLLLSNGDGTFRTAGALAGLSGPAAVAAELWDDDSRPDLAILGAASGNVTLMKNGITGTVPRGFTSVSAASFVLGPLSPDSIAAGFGTGLSPATDSAKSQPLPTQLAGVTVNVTDSAGQTRLAGLVFVSPSQVNFVVPTDTQPGTAVLTVSRDGSAVAQGVATIEAAAPGIFTANSDGKGVPAAQALHVKTDGSQVAENVFRCAAAPGSCAPVPINLGAAPEKVYLLLYATGARHCDYVSANIGGVDAGFFAAIAQGQFAGLDQVNVLLPRQLAGRGEVDLVLHSVCGRTSNTVRINIK